jgi:hypothetical protein
MQPKPTIPEATEAEIRQANDLLEEKYGFVLPEAEAKHFVELVKELKWWDKAGREDSGAMQREFAGELSEVFSTMKGVPANPGELSQDADLLLTAMHLEEKKRVARKITALIVEHRPIPIDENVTEKAVLFLKHEYNLELNDEDLAQVIQYAWRKLWIQEGLESSLEQCFDDLPGITNTQHSAFLTGLDLIVAKLAHNKESKEMDCE